MPVVVHLPLAGVVLFHMGPGGAELGGGGAEQVLGPAVTVRSQPLSWTDYMGKITGAEARRPIACPLPFLLGASGSAWLCVVCP